MRPRHPLTHPSVSGTAVFGTAVALIVQQRKHVFHGKGAVTEWTLLHTIYTLVYCYSTKSIYGLVHFVSFRRPRGEVGWGRGFADLFILIIIPETHPCYLE